MNSGFPVVVVVVAISKMMLIVVVVILFLGEELPLSCFRFVYLQFSVKLLLLLLLFGSVFSTLLTFTCISSPTAVRWCVSRRRLVMSLFENS